MWRTWVKKVGDPYFCGEGTRRELSRSVEKKTLCNIGLVRAFTGQIVPTSVLFGSEVVLTVGFLFISVRYSSLWLGLAMLIQSFGFALHAIQLGDEDAPRWHGWIIYLLISNILSYMVLIALCGGTVATILQRRRLARSKAQTETSDVVAREPVFTAQRQPPAAAT